MESELRYSIKRSSLNRKQDSSTLTEAERVGYEGKLTALHMHALQLGLANSIEEITKSTLDAVQMALGFDWAEFCLVENEQLKLVGIRGGTKGIPVMPLDGPGVVVKAARTKASVILSDTRKDGSYVDHEGFDWQDVPTMLSELAVPVIVDGETLAVLNTESSILSAFTKEDQTLLEILAFHVGSAFRRLKYTEMLRESEERYKMIFDSANDAIFIRDQSGEILEVNRVACDRYGYTHEEFLQMNVQEISCTRPDTPFDRQIEEIGVKNHGTFATVHRRRDGKDVQVEMSSQLIEFRGKQAILSIARDIGERVRYQQKLAALHQHAISLGLAKTNDELVELTLDAMEFTLGFHHAGFEEVDEECVHIKGARGMSIEYGDLSLDGPGVVVRAAKKGRPIRVTDSRAEPIFVDSKLRLASGETVRMLSELAVPVIVDGCAVAVLNVESAELNTFSEQDQILLDTLANHLASAITRVRQDAELRNYAERLEMLVEERTKKLSESERRFRELADLLPEIVIESDRNGCLTFVNHFGLSHLGFNREELLDMVQLFVPEEREQIGNYLKVNSCEDMGLLEHTVIMKNGDRLPVIVHIAPIIREEEPTGFRGIIIDISERKRLERRLAEAERLAAIGETATWVGHDLRNPLQATTAAVYLAKELLASEKPEARNEVMELLEDLDDQVYYMDKIVSDLQDYARPVEAELTETNLENLIEKTVSSLLIPRDVRVSIALQDELSNVMVNPFLLKRVLTNLVTNAIQAMPTGGEMTIAASEMLDSVTISVNDGGVGIPKENLAKLFKPFFTTKAKGQGLGLAVCKRLIEAQGGTISVDSEEGKGSTFTVKVPTTRPAGGSS